jgi:glutamate formiminotransferase
VDPARGHDDGRRGRAGPGVRPADRERFELPVYLYAEAARRSERVKLADVRRGQYEGLKAEIDHRGREPDFGPSRMHPSAGAVAVGARPFLIAYNINLESPDRELAVRIARRIRSRAAGCRGSRRTASSSRSWTAPRCR